MFRNAKTGDKVWDFLYGYGKVLEVDKDELWVEFDESLCIDQKRVYTFDGKLRGVGYPQTLFWNEIKFEIPKKPFDLESELRKLKIVEFKKDKQNYFLLWDSDLENIAYDYLYSEEYPLIKYFDKESIDNFKDNIKGKKITKEEFFKAYRNVFGGRND